MAFDTNSNKYTFLFSIVLVVIVASLLAVTAESLKPLQKRNESREKMQNILSSVGVQAEAEEAEKKFNEYITDQIVIGSDGEVKESAVKAFDIDVLKDYKSGLAKIYEAYSDDHKAMVEELKDFNNGKGANYPLFICTNDKGEKNYIIPLVGKGLWGPIWGYIALKEDMNTVAGATFDHKSETPGLGAEIKEDDFEDQFNGDQIFDGDKFVSIDVMKGGGGDASEHGVDGISGGTITSNGVKEMLERTLKIYEPFFRKKGNI